MRSDAIKKGYERAPHRSLLRATGLVDADFDKPFVGIANSQVDIIPGHVHLAAYGQIAKDEIRKAGLVDGLCCVYVPHTTAGVFINEGADPSVMDDIEATYDRVVPWNGAYRHSEGNAAAHVKATMVGESVTVLVEDGRLGLGTWQAIFFAEFVGPRRRNVWIKTIRANE